MPVKIFVRSIDEYPYHWHDALEIIMVLKGPVNISLGNDNLLLNEGGIAVINEGELHRIFKSREDNEILFIQVDDRFCRNNLPGNSYLFIYCCSAYHADEVPEKYHILKEHIARLVRALTDGSETYGRAETIGALTAMLDNISYNFDFLRWGYGTRPFSEKVVKRLKRIAEHAISDDKVKLGLKELAKETGVSLQYLSNDIKSRFGMTFQQLLYYSKCEHAAKLLLSTDERIVDIALECGFSDTKYLIKHFKKYFNSSPSEFRKMYRADTKKLLCQVRYRDNPISQAINYLK